MVACDICGEVYNIESMHSVGFEWFCGDCYADYVDFLNELQEEEEAALLAKQRYWPGLRKGAGDGLSSVGVSTGACDSGVW